MRNIVFLGAPGSGKGTQSSIIAEKYGLLKLSSGDILRQEVEERGEMADAVRIKLERGELISDELMVALIAYRISKANNNAGVVFDGFPRTLNQAERLDDIMKNMDSDIEKVFFFYVDEKSLYERISNRVSCKTCNAVYNLKTNPPKREGTCDNCGGDKLFIRSDDNIESLKNRIETYNRSCEQVIHFYREKGIVCEIDANADIEQVTGNIIGNMVEFLIKRLTIFGNCVLYFYLINLIGVKCG